jgi:predicted amidohydrolase YtcJ
LRGAEIVATAADSHGLDHLCGEGTLVVDANDLTVMPAFADSHEHPMEASRNTLLVPVDRPRSVAEFTTMVADAARAAQLGEWVLTSIGWHESNLAENRLLTLAELDKAAPGAPTVSAPGRPSRHGQLGCVGGGARGGEHA